MTMNQRAMMTGPVLAFVLACAAWSAKSAPGASAADVAQEVDRMRAAIAANAEKAIEKQGGSRILFKVDAGALREAMVTELRDDVYRTLHDGRIPLPVWRCAKVASRSRSRKPRTGKGY